MSAKKQQEPVAWIVRGGYPVPLDTLEWQLWYGSEKPTLSWVNQEMRPLYALPGAQDINLSDPIKDEREAFREWFEGEQGVAYDGMWSFAKAAWMARAALGAPSVPDGWKLVPIEPTKEMRAAWDSSPICEDDDAEFRRAYIEMLAAAPEVKPCP